jgi:hypothetical protein
MLKRASADHSCSIQGPFPVIAAPIGSTQFAGPPAGSSKFTFDPETFGKSAPYRVAMLGGPNNERATIAQTLLGRASIATTERHLAVDDDEIRAAMLALCELRDRYIFELMAPHPDALLSGRVA